MGRNQTPVRWESMKDSNLREEFIGKTVEIINSRNKSLVGIKGRIIDETKNTFGVRVEKNNNKNNEKAITLMKKDSIFIIEKKIINGNDILSRSEDRIKK